MRKAVLLVLISLMFTSCLSTMVAPAEYVPAIEVPQEIIDALEDPASCAIAVLALRYEFGNSFLAHPSVKGNKQIATAVMEAFEESERTDPRHSRFR